MITAWQFHERTRHRREALVSHPLNWACKPEVFKNYPQRAGLSTLRLPEPGPMPERPLSEILAGPVNDKARLDTPALARILHLTSAFTAQSRHGKDVFHYRSAPSAGALYPCEIYLALGADPDGPGPGLYYYHLPDRSLVRLCQGDALGRAKALAGFSRPLAGMVMFTAIFFRSSWKYRHRAYRYVLLDAGHVLENLHLACRATNMPVEIEYDFDDQGLNALLGIDPRREACLAVAALPGDETAVQGPCPETEQAEFLAKASRCSVRETEYPLLLDFNESASVVTQAGEGPWSGELESLGLPSGRPEQLPPGGGESMGYPECLMHRRTKRNFTASALEKDRAGTFLRMLINPCAPERVRGLAVACFLGHNIDGLRDGLYWLDRYGGGIEYLGKGPSHKEMAQACLDQAWLGQANFHFCTLANLQLVDERAGSRGYRYAMLESGRLGQRVYLAATALNMGACGIGAFYDLEASNLLRLNSRSSLLYLLAAGAARQGQG